MMSLVWLLLTILYWIAGSVLALMIAYLLLLTVAAFFARRVTPVRDQPTTRFAIMIPAHNEERLLPDLLANLNQLDYPRELYSIHVVADNCTDRTPPWLQPMARMCTNALTKPCAAKGMH